MSAQTPAALLLLPGLDGTEVFFRPLQQALPASAQVLTITYPDAAPYSYEGLLESVRTSIASVPRCVVLASSFAGPLAVMLASVEPEKVRGLILCATFLRAPRGGALRLRLMATTPVVACLRLLRRLPVWLLRSVVDPVRVAKGETWRRVSARSLAGRARAVLSVDVRRLLQECQVPVLCVAFDGDRVVPRTCADEIQQHARDARLLVLGGGHLGLFTDPAPLGAAVVRFLEEQASEPSRD